MSDEQVELGSDAVGSVDFDDDVRSSMAVERRLVWKQLAAFATVALVVVVRQLWLA